jgi:hypothetical protein
MGEPVANWTAADCPAWTGPVAGMKQLASAASTNPDRVNMVISFNEGYF